MYLVVLTLRSISVIGIILGTLLAYGFLFNKLGFIFGVITVVIFPVTIIVAPLYEGFSQDNWLSFILIYGGILGVGIFGFTEEKLK